MEEYKYIIGIDPGDENNSGAICVINSNKEVVESYNIRYEKDIEKFDKRIESLQVFYKNVYVIKEGDRLLKPIKKVKYPGNVSMKAFPISLLKEDLSEFYNEKLIQEMVDFAHNFKPKNNGNSIKRTKCKDKEGT